MRPLHFSSAPRQSIVKSDVSSGCPQGARGSPAGVSCVSFASSLPLPFFFWPFHFPDFYGRSLYFPEVAVIIFMYFGAIVICGGVWFCVFVVAAVPAHASCRPRLDGGARVGNCGAAVAAGSAVPESGERAASPFRPIPVAEVPRLLSCLVLFAFSCGLAPPSLPPRLPFFLHFRFSFFFHSPCLSHSRSRSRSLFLLS